MNYGVRKAANTTFFFFSFSFCVPAPCSTKLHSTCFTDLDEIFLLAKKVFPFILAIPIRPIMKKFIGPRRKKKISRFLFRKRYMDVPSCPGLLAFIQLGSAAFIEE